MVKKKNTKASRGLAEDKNPRQNIKIYSDAYFDNAINFLQDIFYTFDLKGRFIRWNKSFSVISGYNDKEISLMKPGDFFRGADVRRVMAAIEKTYKEGEYKVEAEFVTKEGKHIPCEFTGTALKDSAGNIIGLCGSGRNLAERKKVEETLRESEHLLATTFKSIGDAVIAADIVGCVVRMNRVAEHLTGWTLSEAAGRPLADVFHIINQHTRQRVENPVAKVLETGQVQGLANDTMLVSRQGVECIIADSAAAIMDDQTGQAIGVVLVFRDQTKEHAAAEELRESRQRFQGLVETLYDWVWEVDPQGHYTYISPRIRDILGYEPEGLLGKTPFDLMPTEEAQRVSKIFGPLVAEQKPIIALENINLHKDGHPVFLETSGLPFYDVHGKFKGYRGTDRDITERKRTEKALRESERSLAITFSSIGDAVIATDAQDRIVRMNQIAEQLTGWPLKEALGRPLNEVFHIINQHTRLPVENPVGKVLETGKIQGLANDTVLVSRQGVERVIADSAAAIVDDEIRQTVGVVLVFRD